MTIPPPFSSAPAALASFPEAVIMAPASTDEFLPGPAFNGLGDGVRIGDTFRHLFLHNGGRIEPAEPERKQIGYASLPAKAVTADVIGALSRYDDVSVALRYIHGMFVRLLNGGESPLIKENGVDNAFFAIDRFGNRQVVCITWMSGKRWVISAVSPTPTGKWKPGTKFFFCTSDK